MDVLYILLDPHIVAEDPVDALDDVPLQNKS